ncbi:MAG: hypothetical protein U0Z53_09985 [Blastocatellia bacterium]
MPETGSAVVDRFFIQPITGRLLIFNIGIAEIVSILVRKRNAGILAASTFSQIIVDSNAEILSARAVQKTACDSSLVTASLPLIIRHSINATDAILLRSALDIGVALQTQGDNLVLVASDQRLLRAAQTEGLIVFNPETQTVADLDSLLV